MEYIEVIGTAEYTEEVERYIIDLGVSARAATGEVATGELVELRSKVVAQLKGAGLQDEELFEGGATAWSPWFWKKRVGQEAVCKILIKCRNLERAMRALDNLEPLFSNQRHTFSVEFQSPQFRKDGPSVEGTRAAALSSARSKAEFIANEMSVRLSMVLEVQEMTELTRRSGMYGDEEWRGPVSVAAAGAASAAPYSELSRVSRETTLKYRVRYALSKPA